MIRHIVAVNFKSDTPQESKADIFEKLGSLRGHIGGILDYQIRENVSPEEPVIHGFLDLFWFDFEDAAARDAYLIDPGHKSLGAKLIGMAQGGPAGIQVLDFEV